MFQTLYGFNDHKAPASEVAKIIGTKGHGPLNLEVGRMAKRIGKKYEIGTTIREDQTYRWWDLFFSGEDHGGLFIWQLRPELVTALEETGLTGVVQFPEEVPPTGPTRLPEGGVRQVWVDAYERNPVARDRCIEYWGYTCSVCEVDMGDTYGPIGDGFIHVHHIIPISDRKSEYLIDPINDLRPVCPNCHAMLHREDPPLSIDGLRTLIAQAHR
ncbi:MAG: HNH endonuclease [Flavobacteriales bacterium]|nr:HNH endonuclease [Flavobacteriales bacterium]